MKKLHPMATEEKKIIVNICASPDSFGAYAENCPGIYAAGDDVREVKKNVTELIKSLKEIWPQDQWPEPIRDNWGIEWHYDTQSLLKYYEGVITNAALERLTGINKKQLWNYANGVSKPRKQAVEKIEKALHGLGQELMELSL